MLDTTNYNETQIRIRNDTLFQAHGLKAMPRRFTVRKNGWVHCTSTSFG